MSEAPERIWVKTRGVPKYYEFPCEDLPLLVEYVRADRIEELEAKLKQEIKETERVDRVWSDNYAELEAKLAKVTEELEEYKWMYEDLCK